MTGTALEVDGFTSPRFSLRGSASHATTTSGQSADLGVTSNHAEGKFSYVVKPKAAQSAPAAERIRDLIGPAVRDVVRVDVHEVDEDVARCYIADFGGQDVTVALPLALFPEEQSPAFGQSYDLCVVVENGVRRAVLTLRAPNVDALREKKQVLRELVQRLAGV